MLFPGQKGAPAIHEAGASFAQADRKLRSRAVEHYLAGAIDALDWAKLETRNGALPCAPGRVRGNVVHLRTRVQGTLRYCSESVAQRSPIAAVSDCR